MIVKVLVVILNVTAKEVNGKSMQNQERNIYRRARIKAIPCNKNLQSIERASEELGISGSTLNKYELFLNVPPPDTVVLMADTYETPELLQQYCATECPIGRARGICPVECSDFNEIAIRAIKHLEKASKIRKILLNIAAGSEKDKKRLNRVIEWFKDLALIGEELRVLEKERRPLESGRQALNHKAM